MGVAALPKSVVDVRGVELRRFVKLTSTGRVVPIRFFVPRMSLFLKQIFLILFIDIIVYIYFFVWLLYVFVFICINAHFHSIVY